MTFSEPTNGDESVSDTDQSVSHNSIKVQQTIEVPGQNEQEFSLCDGALNMCMNKETVRMRSLGASMSIQVLKPYLDENPDLLGITALEWILKNQKKLNTANAGYWHFIGTVFLCEAGNLYVPKIKIADNGILVRDKNQKFSYEQKIRGGIKILRSTR